MRRALQFGVAIHDEIRQWWDDDAATYDESATHRPRVPAQNAAWTAALARLLPHPPARVLDCGAGTGFLSLTAARLGHEVTAVDISGEMLRRLRRDAEEQRVAVLTQEGRADEIHAGDYDVIMERHLLWTLPDPAAALVAWRKAAVPLGRLILIGHMRESR